MDKKIDYLKRPVHHYKPKKSWINDPNGLVYFNGYYHLFYQHCPDREDTAQEMHWGHARTRDFIIYEELPVALYPETIYDDIGCWSGTAVVKDDTLYVIYTSVHTKQHIQTISVAYSTDGVNFEKYEKNPVIDHYPSDGSHNFRDPAVCEIDGKYYCAVASNHEETVKGRLLLYVSDNLLDWEYVGIMCEWDEVRQTECPSFVRVNDEQYLVAASVSPVKGRHYFSLMFGSFRDNKFNIEYEGSPDNGPDQYAGQVFRDHKGRLILISWAFGWDYLRFAEKDVGCLSIPREVKLIDGKIYCYPVEEVQHLLKDADECLVRTEDGFTVERQGRSPLVYKGEIRQLKILRDSYMAEIFVNGGEEVFTVLL